jgi:hypothetical protein
MFRLVGPPAKWHRPKASQAAAPLHPVPTSHAVLSQLQLARTLQLAGDITGSLDIYRQLDRTWKNADPGSATATSHIYYPLIGAGISEPSWMSASSSFKAPQCTRQSLHEPHRPTTQLTIMSFAGDFVVIVASIIHGTLKKDAPLGAKAPGPRPEGRSGLLVTA